MSKPARTIVVVGASCLIPVLAATAPLIAVIAVLIAMTSPGAILFRQERLCLGGRRFLMLKFRTMRMDADESLHRDYVLAMVRATPDGAKRAGAH